MTTIRFGAPAMARPAIRNSRNMGFTLVELMVAMAVGSIIMAAVLTSFIAQHNVYIAQDEVVQMQQNARVAIDMMSRDIQSAGYNPNHLTGTVGITTTGINATTGVASTLTFTRDNGAGVLETVTYSLPTTKMLTLNTSLPPAGTTAADWPAAIAEGISNLEFRYLDENGDPTNVFNNIRSIQMSIMAETAHTDLKSSPASQTYTTPSGATWTSTPKYRSKYFTATVQCRNLGL